MNQTARINHNVNYFLVALGGGIGSVVRYGVVCSTDFLSIDARWAEFIVNVSGSFLMGVIVGWFAWRGRGGGKRQLFLTTGILGGYTTFSGFSLDAMTLIEQGHHAIATIYIIASVAISIGGLFAGLGMMRHFAGETK